MIGGFTNLFGKSILFRLLMKGFFEFGWIK